MQITQVPWSPFVMKQVRWRDLPAGFLSKFFSLKASSDQLSDTFWSSATSPETAPRFAATTRKQAPQAQAPVYGDAAPSLQSSLAVPLYKA